MRYTFLHLRWYSFKDCDEIREWIERDLQLAGYVPSRSRTITGGMGNPGGCSIEINPPLTEKSVQLLKAYWTCEIEEDKTPMNNRMTEEMGSDPDASIPTPLEMEQRRVLERGPVIAALVQKVLAKLGEGADMSATVHLVGDEHIVAESVCARFIKKGWKAKHESEQREGAWIKVYK
jgi:hypothetical protein